MTLDRIRAAALAVAMLLPALPASAQMSGADVLMRLDRMEAQMRQLTGLVEQLQYRNQQLEQQLKRMQDDTEYRFQEMGGRGGAAPAPARVPAPASSGPQRRGDAFDPNQNPNAPGVPQSLGGGSLPATAGAPPGDYQRSAEADVPPVGAPGGRDPGAPLDLGTMSSAAANDPSLMPPVMGNPAARAPATGAQVAAVQPPTQSPRDQFDLGYGYVLHRDYALAEQTLRDFLKRYPDDRMTSDAEYWLGESLFQQQRYREAAESFLKISTKHDTAPKAPDALVRLGQSLAALGEKETACAALGEVNRKYPKASVSVKQTVEREQKRVKC